LHIYEGTTDILYFSWIRKKCRWDVLYVFLEGNIVKPGNVLKAERFLIHLAGLAAEMSSYFPRIKREREAG